MLLQSPPPPPPAIVVNCRVPDDPADREWVLLRELGGETAGWRLEFRRGMPPAVRADLPLPGAAPRIGPDGVALEFRSADGGGPRISLDARAKGTSTLAVRINAEPEVTVEGDLDGAPGAMNTDGRLSVTCMQARSSFPQDAPRGVEWMLGAGYGWSIDVLQSAAGRRYAATTISWGRDLTGDAGPGWLRGRLMWAVEAMPLYGQRAPAQTLGLGLSPLVWRWRFTPGPWAAPFAELAFGGLFTRAPVPEGTERVNFLTHGSFGIAWRPASRWSLVTAYRFQHISNGNQLSSNPGVNAHVLWFGLAR